jgi:hypothetical protein
MDTLKNIWFVSEWPLKVRPLKTLADHFSNASSATGSGLPVHKLQSEIPPILVITGSKI